MKKEIAFILVVLALILLGSGVAWAATGKATVKPDNTDASLNPESTLTFLRNLRWLRYLASGEKSTLNTKLGPSSEKNPSAITSKTETEYAVIYGCDDTTIPSYLLTNFDRIFRMVANYFNLPETEKEKVVVWVMDYQTLQEMNHNTGETKVAALYAPGFHYFFFCPEYMKEYYVAHELLHYFIDTVEENVVTELTQIIIRRELASLVLDYQPG